MAEYGCSSPLWINGANGELIDTPEPEELSLSVETVHRLKNWTEAFNATLNQAYPPESDFATREEAEAFEQEGLRLWNKLQEELGSKYNVVYYSYKQQRVITRDYELVVR